MSVAPLTDDPIAFYKVPDIMRKLGVGRAVAYRLARELGVRLGRRKLAVPKDRLDRWLATSRAS